MDRCLAILRYSRHFAPCIRVATRRLREKPEGDHHQLVISGFRSRAKTVIPTSTGNGVARSLDFIGSLPLFPAGEWWRRRSNHLIDQDRPPLHSTICVWVTFASSRPLSLLSRVSHTWVRRPRCSGTLSAIT